MKKKIVHIIPNEKFTSRYINFMLNKMKEYNHEFITVDGKFKLDLMEDEYIKKIIVLKNEKEILKKKIKGILNNSDKIIVSGLFKFPKYLYFLPSKIMCKVYLQFWGGDFYPYRNVKFFSKMNISKYMLHSCIKRCKGIINLVPDDYNELCKIFKNNTKHFVATMPNDPRRVLLYEKFDNVNNIEKGRIIIGNSATKENHHIEILKKLEHLKNENIEILCPLSYGDTNYASEVIKIGQQIFKSKFIPITKYMEFEEYLRLLLTCEVGIFNNDRQQALDNIYILLRYGKKVYLRENTSMWNNFQDNNFKVYGVCELSEINYNDLFTMKLKEKKINYDESIKLYTKDVYYWQTILNEKND